MLDTIYTSCIYLHLSVQTGTRNVYILSMQVDLYKNTWLKLTPNTKGGTVHKFSCFIYIFFSF